MIRSADWWVSEGGTVIEIVVGSEVDRDLLYAEIKCNGEVWAEVFYTRERKSYVVAFFGRPNNDPIEVNLADARRALVDARNALVKQGAPDPPLT